MNWKSAGCTYHVNKPSPSSTSRVRIQTGFHAHLIVEDLVIVEVKAIEMIAPVHKKQLLTYLKLAGKRLGLSINFNVTLINRALLESRPMGSRNSSRWAARFASTTRNTNYLWLRPTAALRFIPAIELFCLFTPTHLPLILCEGAYGSPFGASLSSATWLATAQRQDLQNKSRAAFACRVKRQIAAVIEKRLA